MVLRRAMAEVLPEKVQWRADKVNFLPNFSHGLLTFERERLDELIIEDPAVITGYVDIPVLRKAYGRLVSQESIEPKKVLAIWRAVSLALWLRHTDQQWKGG